MVSKNWTNWKTRIRSINKITNGDAIYLAALLDGEGSFCLSTVGGKRKTINPQITITNTNADVIRWVTSLVGKGGVFIKKKEKPHWKDCYVYRVNGRYAVSLCKRVIPYLKIKKMQAETIIAFGITTQRGHRVAMPQEVLERRAELKQTMSILNRRGEISAFN